MFDKEFFPTNRETLDLMEIECAGMVCYEPHAGKGDICEYLYQKGAKRVLASELNDDLRKILTHKVDEIIGTDFFKITADQISHVELIVMNPPFSNADKHIKHAKSIAPPGCKIISIMNWETLNNPYSWDRKAVLHDVGLNKPERYHKGFYKNIGKTFSTAERTTDVEIGLWHYTKEGVFTGFDFENFFLDEDEQENNSGIATYDEVRAVVGRYVNAVRAFDEVREKVKQMEVFTKPVGISDFKMSLAFGDRPSLERQDFIKSLQKKSWNYIIGKMDMERYATSGLKADINKFVETQSEIPFTMKNIYAMFDVIFQTRGERFNKALEEAVDNFTKYTKENRYDVKGWATNSGHMLNKKFIVEGIFEPHYNGIKTRYAGSYSGGNVNKIDDLIKVIRSLGFCDGVWIYDEKQEREVKKHFSLREILIHNNDGMETLKRGVWQDCGFFKIKGYLKGSAHIVFKDVKVWENLNRKYAQIKGQDLPSGF